MIISLCVAEAENRVIGKSNGLPWYLPSDLRRFKEITTGHPVIMGRKTFESILSRLGKPLPNRENIVITRDRNYKAEGAHVVHSLQEAISLAKTDEVFIIGGAQIYEQALPEADRIYMTYVHANIEGGDTFFPELDPTEWEEIFREAHTKDDKNEYDYTYVTLERRQ